jgi:hypothetical protein
MGALQQEIVDESIDSGTGLRRFANDWIRTVAIRRARDAGTVVEFLCECGDLRCQRLVDLTLSEYDALPPGAVLAHAS